MARALQVGDRVSLKSGVGTQWELRGTVVEVEYETVQVAFDNRREFEPETVRMAKRVLARTIDEATHARG